MSVPRRYQPDRVLPRAAFIPGRGRRPKPATDEHSPGTNLASLYIPADDWRTNAEYLFGVDLYNQGFFWEAHEAWEGLWHAASSDAIQAQFLQGLIQCAAACLKVAIGNADSARRLAERGLARLEQVHEQRVSEANLAGGWIPLGFAQQDGGSRDPPDIGDRVYMGLDVASFVEGFRRFIEDYSGAIERRPLLHLTIDP